MIDVDMAKWPTSEIQRCIKRIAEMLDDGKSISEISASLGITADTTRFIVRMLNGDPCEPL